MSHLPLDARAILHYLNELGYKNISAEQLKEFLKDLRKLIKYEERLGVDINCPNRQKELFNRTTAAFRAKVDARKKGINPEEDKEKKCKSILKNSNKSSYEPYYFSIRSNEGTLSIPPNTPSPRATLSTNTSKSNAPPAFVSSSPVMKRDLSNILKEMSKENADRLNELERRLESIDARLKEDCEKQQTLQENKENQNKNQDKVFTTEKSKETRALKSAASQNIVQRPRPKGHDPVALYHYYQKEWAHFENQIPGNHSRAKVRWDIKNKF